MRPTTLLMLSLFTVAVVLSGCAGPGPEFRTLPGDYFPTDPGTDWTYRINVTAWYDNQEARSTGTIDRSVMEVVDTTGTRMLRTVTFRDFIHAVPPPALNIPAGNPLADYLAYLFDPNGGMQSWSEQFALLDTTGDGTTDRIQRFAEGPPAGPLLALLPNRPFIYTPILTGAQAINSTSFITVPFFSNNETLSGRVSNLGVQYRDPDSFLGEAPQRYAYVAEALQATVDFNGVRGSCTGYCKTSLARDLGPVEKDIDLEFRVGGPWLRIHAMITATRYRTSAP